MRMRAPSAIACALILAFAGMLGGWAAATPGLAVPWLPGPDTRDPVRLDARFARCPAVTIPLMRQVVTSPNGGGSVKSVTVRAFHDGVRLFVQVGWTDSTHNDVVNAPEQFRDAVALEFPVLAGDQTSPFMGDADHPVNIWQWKADLDRQIATPSPAVPEPAPGTLSGQQAGNLVSAPPSSTAAENLTARGFGTLAALPDQEVWARGRRTAKGWTVVFVRTLTTGRQGEAQFQPGGKGSFTVAVWDGAPRERNGMKSLSMAWWPMALQAPPRSAGHGRLPSGTASGR